MFRLLKVDEVRRSHRIASVFDQIQGVAVAAVRAVGRTHRADQAVRVLAVDARLGRPLPVLAVRSRTVDGVRDAGHPVSVEALAADGACFLRASSALFALGRTGPAGVGAVVEESAFATDRLVLDGVGKTFDVVAVGRLDAQTTSESRIQRVN